jgi:hypothetical protein
MSKMTEYANGDRAYFDDSGRLHRVGGPAIEWCVGHKTWFLHGLQHRADGPAGEWVNGKKDWYWNGNVCTEAEYALLRFIHV